MPLSKLYTAKIVADFIRGIIKELDENELQPEEVLSYVNLAQQIVYNELPEDEYIDETTLTIASDEADFSAKNVEKALKLVDSNIGIIDVKSMKEFDELTNAPSKRNRIYATTIGEKFKLFKGENVSSYGTLTLTFVKRLTPCTTEASFLDVKDKYVPKVIDIAKKLVYEQLGKTSE